MALTHGTRAAVACKRCRERKVKCDLAKPTCGTCRARGDECGGYQQRRQIKWMKPSAFSPPTAPTRSSTSPRAYRMPSPRLPLDTDTHTTFSADELSSASSRLASPPSDSQWTISTPASAPDEPTTSPTPIWQSRPSKFWSSAILEISSDSVGSSAALATAFDIYLPSNSYRKIAMQQPFWTLPQAYEQHAMQSLELVQTGRYPLLQQTLNCIVLVFWGRKHRRPDLLTRAAAQYAAVLRGVREELTSLRPASGAEFPLHVFVMMLWCIWIEKAGVAHHSNAAVHALGIQQLALSLNVPQTDRSTFQQLMTIARPVSFFGCVKRKAPSSVCDTSRLYQHWFHPRAGELASPLQVLIDSAIKLPALLQDIDNIFIDHPTNRFSRIAALRSYLERAEQLDQALEATQAAHKLQGQTVASEWDADGALGQCYSPYSVDEAHWWMRTCYLRQTICEIFVKIRQLLIRDLGEADAGARALRVGLVKDFGSTLYWIEQGLATVEHCNDWALGISTVSTANIMLSVGWTRLAQLAAHSEAAAARVAELEAWHAAATNAMDQTGFRLDVGA